MSEATTGSAQANARVSTMPKLSCPIEGATSAFAPSSVAGQLVLAQEADDVDAVVGHPQPREEKPDRQRIGARDREPEPVRRRISGHARNSTCSPLRGSWRPAKTTRCSRPPAGRRGRDEDAVRDHLVLPRSQRACDAFARSETAMRWSIRSIRKPQTGVPYRIQPRSPEAWNVATIGQRAAMSAVRQIVGVIGSWRWSDVEALPFERPVIRKYERGESTMFGSDRSPGRSPSARPG